MKTQRDPIIAMSLIMLSLLIPFSALSATNSSIGQGGFNRLTPGTSTKADVERVLGQPLRDLSGTLSEYKSDKESEKIFVQYRRDSAVIERIEVVYSVAVERADVLRSQNLPPQPAGSQTNAKGRLEEYFSPKNVVLTYLDLDTTSGVSSVGYYSRELFESALRPAPANAQPPPGPQANAEGLVVPEATEFTVVTTENISSKTAVVGDRVIFKVDQPVVVKGRIVINEGALVKGSVVSAERSGRLGKGGKLAIRIESTIAVDGQEIKLRASKGKEGGGAVASTVALTVLFGPLGLLKRGSEATIKEGTKIKVFTDEQKQVRTGG